MYPWNKKRLYNNQDWDMPTLHMLDPSIEYYGIKVLEEIYDFDEILVNEFPKRIQFRYSNILDRVYAMNVCPICDAPQGKNYVYRDVNKKIKSMEKINIVK